ncbi:hypothetical protein CRI94_07950 [Longibacter salinarum]|uniref:Uncharacterized protein n=1 Tax=Longibacter salinarum TaxID=1850348 RepID=A0A2A8CZC1_9BACT|nr:hypothetical protein CRI94_07950 [Longibacter salinarum]
MNTNQADDVHRVLGVIVPAISEASVILHRICPSDIVYGAETKTRNHISEASRGQESSHPKNTKLF